MTLEQQELLARANDVTPQDLAKMLAERDRKAANK
jgi:hypothetical protein